MTDSLALPRHIPEQVSFEDTWPELLKNALPGAVFHQVSMGGGTVEKLWAQLFYHQNFRPDLCIIQSGIVDCSPRALTELEQAIINSNRITRKLGNIVIPKIKTTLRRNRYVQLVPEQRYEKYMKMYRSQKFECMAIGIIPSPSDYEKIVPGIAKNINRYNQILLNVFGPNFLDTSDFGARELMSDHHHLNKIGHEKLAKILIPMVNKVITNSN